MKTRRLIIKCLVLTVASLAIMNCKSSNQEAETDAGSGKLKVVTTATMVTDLLKQIGGDKVSVHGLIPVEEDPHHYEEKSKDVKQRMQADAIFYIGLHFESNFERPFQAMIKQGKNVFALGESIEKSKLRSLVGEGSQHDCHVWGDVAHMITMADAAVAGLVKADPKNADFYKKQGEAYKKELSDLQAWIAKRVAEIPEGQRKLVTSHDAFDYFANAYGFEVAPIQGISTVADTKLEDLNKVVDFIKKHNIKTVFGENSTSDKGVDLVAKTAGIKVSAEPLAADSTFEAGDVVTVNGESYDRGTYIGMVKHNVNTIVKGLK